MATAAAELQRMATAAAEEQQRMATAAAKVSFYASDLNFLVLILLFDVH